MIINLFCTGNVASGRSAEMSRMLASVRASVAENPDATIRLLLLFQNCTVEPETLLPEDCRAFTSVMAIPGMASLSAARNILLDEAERRGCMAEDGIVAFPDDDCWYPSGTLKYLKEAFAKDPELDFWFCGYSADPQAIDPTKEREATLHETLLRASSNTMIFRRRVVSAVGPFDPELGVGTPAKGGEDIDYVVRAHAVARRTVYLPIPCIGHRDPNRTLRLKYYPAVLSVTARHAAAMPGLRLPLLRKFAVGAAWALRREMAVSELSKAYRNALREWSRSRRGSESTDRGRRSF